MVVGEIRKESDTVRSTLLKYQEACLHKGNKFRMSQFYYEVFY